MSQRGQVYPLFAFFLIAMLAVSALSVDIGYYRYQQRLQQTAADSAALSGASASQSSSSSSVITTAAQNDAATDGFDHTKTGTTVNVNSKYKDNYTTNGTGGAQASASGTGVQVTITKQYGRFFGGLFFKSGVQSITTSAVAILKAKTSGTPCITGLGSAPSATFDNGVKINGPNCGIAINGDQTCNGGSINVASWAVNSAAVASGCSSPNYTPTSPAPSSAILDPCKFYNGCLYIQQNIDGKSPDSNCGSAVAGATIGGTGKKVTITQVGDGKGSDGTSSFTLGSFMCFNGATFTNVNFAPGFYVIENGAAFAGTNTGTGVVFYILNDTGCSAKCSTSGDVLDMSTSNANMEFTAPTDGSVTVTKATDGSSGTNYQGVLFYQNPSGLSGITPGCKSGGGTELNCVEVGAQITNSSGTCPPGMTGIWYMPFASLYFNGQNGDCFTGNLIFDDATFKGNGSSVSIYPPTGGPSGLSLYVPYLVE
jgi:Flp pilus assembly protein TadG